MSKVSVLDRGWIDLVFEGRNHEYGAYQLRKEDSRTTILAFVTGIGIMALLVGVPVAINYLRNDEAVTIPSDPGPIIIELDNPDPFVEPEKPKPVETKPAGPAPANVNPTREFKPLEATNQPVVTPLPKTDDFKTDDPGLITKAGNPEGVVGGVPEGTGKKTDTGTGTTGTGDGIETTLTVDKMPEFPGGIDEFLGQVGNKYRVPEMDVSKTFKVFVSFVVETDGTMSNIKVLRNPGHGLGEEAMRVLKTIKTKWKPGQKNGKAVRTAYNLPITVNVK